MNKNKKILIGSISAIAVVILGIAIILLVKNIKKKDKLKEIQDSIENVFFYLPEEKYDNLNDIPDYCKISIVYGTDYMKNDALLSTDDYDTVLDKKSDNTIEAYSTETILSAVKKVLGESVTINFEQDENGDYPFIEENGCGYNNDSIGVLSYNEARNYVYSLNDDSENISKFYVKWGEKEVNDNTITLTAKALLVVPNDDGSYTAYADGSMNLIAGTIDSGDNVETALEDLYETRSRTYVITLNKSNDDYTWTNYEVIDNIYNPEIIVD